MIFHCHVKVNPSEINQSFQYINYILKQKPVDSDENKFSSQSNFHTVNI